MAFQLLHKKSYHLLVRRNFGFAVVLAISALMLFGCSVKQPVPEDGFDRAIEFKRDAPYNRPYQVNGKRYYPLVNPNGYKERGIASWYGAESGNRTAMGVKFNPDGLSAAHKTLPLPSRVKVTNLQNGRSIILVVNDRGPFAKNRLIDLSKGAAKAIGVKGLVEVEVEYIGEYAGSNR
ncbi:septal ring lytic transglycosylase RlpA family protein [Methylotuvimicrobium buryatense]|uniref:Endolytic peptidoglycan transglycosylase RlpA n=1 Tax=Methylotuvimicrobium buryatense TaxID=95641 RepID=A0A4P9UW00_METBY|nr:septal ring lytic transglycosylase RlpA family protein [Methylotuvimicrobium buryatense]QCW84843.1 septal ring lytic transglycosylase RlpA family protein [Methylotuvimicrobium buryatense]